MDKIWDRNPFEVRGGWDEKTNDYAEPRKLNATKIN